SILNKQVNVINSTFSLTEDGIQEEFGLLTKLLLSKIKASQPARIVNVSALGHRKVTGIEFETLNDPNAQEPRQRYRQSKLANVLFTDELNRRYFEGEQVYANSLHPGVVDTNMLRRDDFSIAKTLLSFSISPEDGAITTLYCATSPEIEEKNYRGRYFDPFGIEVEKSSCAKDDDLAKKFWEFTENLINVILSQE
ncbi:8988_t:CDS:2, partial [Gigaspora rosea]